MSPLLPKNIKNQKIYRFKHFFDAEHVAYGRLLDWPNLADDYLEPKEDEENGPAHAWVRRILGEKGAPN